MSGLMPAEDPPQDESDNTENGAAGQNQIFDHQGHDRAIQSTQPQTEAKSEMAQFRDSLMGGTENPLMI